jgi:hypothetical protein
MSAGRANCAVSAAAMRRNWQTEKSVPGDLRSAAGHVRTKAEVRSHAEPVSVPLQADGRAAPSPWVGPRAALPQRRRLGPSLFGLRVYAPWKLFVWRLVFDTQAPDVIARAGIVAAFGGLASGAAAIGGTVRRARHKMHTTTFGSARWANLSDVRATQLQGDRGVVLGVYRGRYLRHDGPEQCPGRCAHAVGQRRRPLVTDDTAQMLRIILPRGRSRQGRWFDRGASLSSYRLGANKPGGSSY